MQLLHVDICYLHACELVHHTQLDDQERTNKATGKSQTKFIINSH